VNDVVVKVTSELGHELVLHRDALNHILFGDLSDRVDRSQKPTKVEKVLKGGLHTKEGWNKLSAHHPDVVHLKYFDSNLHSFWFFARELQNGVIALKIPKHLFNSRAASITKFPDVYYKSGHLWKTLFPIGFKESDIISVLEEGLQNLDKEESKEGEIVGYARLNEPLKVLRIVIMYRDNKINSIFPSWTQPNTGNNGKVFSHFENIGFVMAESTEFLDSRQPNKNLFKSFINDYTTLDILKSHTPNIFLSRSRPNKNLDIWSEKRDRFLSSFAMKLSKSEVSQFFDYVVDFQICKNHELIVQEAYEYSKEKIKKCKSDFNLFQIPQNIIESLVILHAYDLQNKTEKFRIAILYLTKNMVSFIGIDTWVKRRIYCKIMDLLPSYESSQTILDFIHAFAESPTRREIYKEFSFDTQRRLALKEGLKEIPDELIRIIDPTLDLKIKYKHFVNFLKDELGETYSFHFNDEFRTKLSNTIIERKGDNYSLLIQDNLRFIRLSDFSHFFEHFSPLLKYLIINSKMNGIEEPMQRIIYDYCRIQSAQRFRFNLAYKDYWDIPYNQDPLTFPLQFTILKHERIISSLRVEQLVDCFQKFASIIGSSKLEKEIEKSYVSFQKESPPLPSPLPEYIFKRHPELAISSEEHVQITKMDNINWDKLREVF